MYFILRADALGSRRGVESSLLQCWIHKRVFMVCERISVCLGRKLFDLQKSQKTSRMSPCSNWPLLTHENGWSCSGLTVEKIRFTAWMGEQQKESPERKKLILKKISLKINQRTFHSPIKMLLELILMMSDFTSALSADQQGFSVHECALDL
ncbi:uncharacterized protein [Equus przewalskii]|uniref:Uncharacterized protein isoform X3 n=1 Tax=Equus przewalskii TaxID=9798 RepID=A0ABM4MLT2_EQUPR